MSLESEINKLSAELRWQMQVGKLFDDLMNAKDSKMLSDAVFTNLQTLETDPKLFKHVNAARERIAFMRVMKLINYSNN